MKKFIKIFIVIILVTSTSCLDEESIPIINIGLEDSARLVEYIESKGDFPNSNDAPALILASELYNNINNYWVIDIRSAEEFTQGHIESAFNILPANLIQVVDSLNLILPFKQIVVVSKNGQSSTYFTCILRIAGYHNVFSLNYGMAAWHNQFASDWLNALGVSSEIQYFSNTDYPKNDIISMPSLEFPEDIKSIEQKVQFRLDQLLKEGFNQDYQYIDIISSGIHNYLICYGIGRLYYAPSFVPYGYAGHPENTIWYKTTPVYDFRSTRYLQTLPNNKTIHIYSGDGHQSACIVAYLRFLGYDAKTLLYGANQLFYPRLEADPEIVEYAFSQEDIMNYPYVLGN